MGTSVKVWHSIVIYILFLMNNKYDKLYKNIHLGIRDVSGWKRAREKGEAWKGREGWQRENERVRVAERGSGRFFVVVCVFSTQLSSDLTLERVQVSLKGEDVRVLQSSCTVKVQAREDLNITHARRVHL